MPNTISSRLLSEWHPSKNLPLTPEKVTSVAQRLWWVGTSCGHEWEARLADRTKGNTGCPFCAGNKILTGFNDLATLFPEISNQWHPTKNTMLPTLISAGSHKKAWWVCDKGHEWEASIKGRTSKGYGCPFCWGRVPVIGENDLKTLFTKIADQWHPTKNNSLLPSEVTAKSGKRVWWVCDKGHEWESVIANRTSNNSGCPVCSNRKLVRGVNDFATLLPELAMEWSDKNNVSLENFSPRSDFLGIWIGDKCRHEWSMKIASRYRGSGCLVCAGKVISIGNNDLDSKFPLVADEWHPTKNGTLLPTEVMAGSDKKAWWLASCGHEWEATIKDRTNKNSGCPFCALKKVIPGITDLGTKRPEIAAQWHQTKNANLTPQDFSMTSGVKAWWSCEKGHEWKATISGRTNGHNCPICAGRTTLAGFNDLQTTNPILASEWHPTKNGTLNPQQVSAFSHKKVWWLCGKNHEWKTDIGGRQTGNGCPICANKQLSVGQNDLLSQYPNIAAEWHPVKNEDKLPDSFTGGSNQKAWWVCNKGHEWEAVISSRTGRGYGCRRCSSAISKAEKEIMKYLESLGLDVDASNRSILGGKEIDIYLPEKKIGIEFNGVYWHSEKNGKGRNYHYDKWLAAKSIGIQLIQIWEDDWNRDKNIILNGLKHKIGLSSQEKVFARKTTVGIIPNKEAEEFLTENHIQGFASGSYYLGLKEKSTYELKAVLVLKKEGKNSLNIIRYATNANVIGGFTKLLSYSEKTYSPDSFITFSDHCISDGGLYTKNGFIADKELPPDYMYVVNDERKHKFGYRLKKFRDDPNLIWQEGLSERELAELNNLPRIWDAGKTRWVKHVESSENNETSKS